MIDNIKRYIMPIFFTVAFAAFMAVSMPKVGAMFFLYREQGIIWPIASYGAAITIDALIGLLTYATLSKQRAWYIQGAIWLFVFVFALYSTFLNWVFDEQHLPPINSVWMLPTSIPGWNVQQLTTLLISSVPFGILGFTLIARLIREEKKPVSLEELRQAAADVQERAAFQQIIDTANVGQGTAWATRRINAGKAMLKEMVARGTLAEELEQLKPESSAEESGAKIISITDAHHAKSDEHNAEESGAKNEPDRIKIVGSSGSAGGKTITIKEAASRLNLSESYVRELRNNGTLRCSPRNRNLLLKSSVARYESIRQNGHNKDVDTGELQAVIAED